MSKTCILILQEVVSAKIKSGHALRWPQFRPITVYVTLGITHYFIFVTFFDEYKNPIFALKSKINSKMGLYLVIFKHCAWATLWQNHFSFPLLFLESLVKHLSNLTLEPPILQNKTFSNIHFVKVFHHHQYHHSQ